MPPTIPDTVLQTAVQKIARLQAREFDVLRDVKQYFEDQIPDFQRDLDEYFFRHFVLTVGGKKDWEPDVPASADAVADSFDHISKAIDKELDEDLGEQLTDEYDESYLFALWELNSYGVDVSDVPPPPDRKRILALLLLGGIEGLNYRDRLHTWGDTYRQKFREWVRSSARIGRDYDGTIGGARRIMQSWQGRVEALAGDELHRASTGGTRDAWALLPGIVSEEVWLTREDPLVCPICAAKHLTITRDQPIRDSHPRCRCIKVPILLDLKGQPVDYVAFLRSIGKR